LIKEMTYPNQSNGIPRVLREAEDAAGGLQPLLMEAEEAVSSISQGIHGRSSIGQGESFWQFRRYQFGDPSSLIDWRQSAKSRYMFVRETEWESAQTVWLWRDGSKSMNFRSSDQYHLKSYRADLLLLGMASLFLRGGEKIALIGSSTKPSGSRNILSQICSMISSHQTMQTDLPQREQLPHQSKTLWFGDFLSPLDEIRETIANYSEQGTKGHIVQILDFAEKQFTYDGRILFEDLEQKRKHVLVKHCSSIRRNYQELLREHCDQLAQVARSFGWGFSLHLTNQRPKNILRDLYVHFSE